MEKKINFEAFVRSYLGTASWVTCESDENTDFTKEAIKQAEKDCQLFIDKVIEKYGKEKGTKILTTPGNDLDYLAPHDFFLTRNGHGAGFWDNYSNYQVSEEIGDELTAICKEIGSTDCIHTRGKKSKLTFF